MTQMVTGLFDSYDAAAVTVRELEAAGLPHSAISIVANNAEGNWLSKHSSTVEQRTLGAETGASLGALVGGGAGLLAGLGLLGIPGLGPVVAAGLFATIEVGVVAGTALGAAGGLAAGSIIGALTGAGVGEEHAHVYAEGVRRGGAVVIVRAADENAVTAQSIIKRNKSVDPETRGDAYRTEGWGRFNESTAPYTRAQTEKGARPIA